MCLAVPGKVVRRFEQGRLQMASVDFQGVRREVCVEHVPDAEVGDYVLVHVGFALSRIDAAEARRVFELLAQLEEVGA